MKTLKMMESGEYIYDGWIAIDNWDEKNISDVIQSISEALLVYSLRIGSFFKWKPKYIDDYEPKSCSDLGAKENAIFLMLYNNIKKVNEEDKRAIYRSISWLNQGRIVDNPSARFLFYILLIESLVTYIEKEAKPNSWLFHLKCD